MAAHVVMPAIHRVFSNLKTWGLGVYHGLRRKHLKAYLDEFTFRFNRRRSQTRRLRHPPRSRRHPQTHHLQDADLTGLNGMSLLREVHNS